MGRAPARADVRGRRRTARPHPSPDRPGGRRARRAPRRPHAPGGRAAPRGPARQHARVPVLARRGGPRRGRRRRDQPTRRGPELARDILHTDCRILVTERAHLPLLRGLDLPGVRILVTGTEEYEALLAPYAAAKPGEAALRTPGPDSRLLLYFTSGSTGAPKAAICSQGRLAAAGAALARQFTVTPDDVHYICMPLFHGNAVIADWLPALVGGAPVALRRRFSASAFLDDVRAYGATYFTYVGRAIQYLLATEPRPDDRSHPCGSASAPRPGRWTRPASPSASASGWWRATEPPRAAPPSSAPRTPRRAPWAGRARATTWR